MNIVVCIKQVPDIDDIKWTKENNLARNLMLSCLNEQDKKALNILKNLKKSNPEIKITAISMGPKQAQDVLNYALSVCCDRAILLCDKMFAASDTLATSKVLARAIKKYVSDFDLIITGQFAADGDTAQVPVSLAQILDLPDISNVYDISDLGEDKIRFEQKADDKLNTYEITLPCLAAINSDSVEDCPLMINDYIRAQNTGIEVYGLDDLGLNREEVGILGSPTVVWRAFRPEFKKNAKEITTSNLLEILGREEK